MKTKVNLKRKKKTDRILNPKDRRALKKIIRKSDDGRVVRRAIVLQMIDLHHPEKLIDDLSIASGRTARNIRARYESGGLASALYDKVRSGKPPELSVRQNQRIAALACSVPPDGYARWTLELLCEESSKSGIVESVSREAIRIILKNHDLKPWKEKMWCIPKIDEEYIERMEEVLAVYEKPLNPKEPVV